jgi:hypothetical protein
MRRVYSACCQTAWGRRNLRRGAHAVGDNMADAAGHHRQGDVKGVQAVAEASGQVEHRTIGHQIDGFVGHAVGVDIRHHLFLRVLAQVLAVDLFRHVADVKDKYSRFRPVQRLAINHVFTACRRGHHVRRGDSLLEIHHVPAVVGRLQTTGRIDLRHHHLAAKSFCRRRDALADQAVADDQHFFSCRVR